METEELSKNQKSNHEIRQLKDNSSVCKPNCARTLMGMTPRSGVSNKSKHSKYG